MIVTESGQIKLGNIVLPGTYYSCEIEGDSVVDEVSVEGRAVNPKQAVGYTEGKVKFVTLLTDQPPASKYDQLELIQSLFKKSGQGRPVIHQVIDTHCNARGINQVIFKKMKSEIDNQTDQLKLTLEFWESVPIVIETVKVPATTAGNSPNPAPSVSPEFQAYLAGETGEGYQKSVEAANKIGSKYAAAYEAHRRMQEAHELAMHNHMTLAEARRQELQEIAAQQSGSRYAAMASAYTRGLDKSQRLAAVDDDAPKGVRFSAS